MSGTPVTINGQHFDSASAAAVSLYEAGEKSPSKIAKVINDAAGNIVIKSQTVFAALPEGKAAAKRRSNLKKVVDGGRSGKYTANMLAMRSKLELAEVNQILRDNKIDVPNQKDLDKRMKEAAEAKQAKLDSAKAEKAAAKAAAKATETPKAQEAAPAVAAKNTKAKKAPAKKK